MRALALTALLGLAASASAQPTWVRVAPVSGPTAWWTTGADGFLYGSGSEGRLYRSPDGGVTAERIGESALPSGPDLVASVYAAGSVVAAWFSRNDGLNGQAFFSSDGGQTWGGGPAPFSYVDDFDAVGDTLVFATLSETTPTGFGPLRVVWSADDGLAWVSQPLDANPFPSGEGQFSRSLAVDGGALYAATTRGLYRATRGAEDWVLVTEGDLGNGGGRLNLYNAAAAGGAAYVSQGDGCGSFLPGVYRRLPGETAWERRDVEALVGASVTTCYGRLAAAGETVVQTLSFPAGVINPGVPVSFDRGDTWSFVGEGLPVTSDGSRRPGQVFAANGTIYLYASGCETPSCFEDLYRLVPEAGTAVEPAPPSWAFRISPNPVEKVLTVALAETQGVTVRVFDVSGRVVQEERPTGAFVHLDVRRLPSGVYVVEVSNAERRGSARFTVAR